MIDTSKVVDELTLNVVAVTPAYKSPDGTQFYEYTTIFSKMVNNESKSYKIELYGVDNIQLGYYLPRLKNKLYYVAKDKDSVVRGRIIPTFTIGEFLHK